MGVGIQCQTMQQDVRWGGPAMEAGGKNSPGQPTLRASSQARPWAWVQELFWGLGESHSLEEGPLPPTSPPSLPLSQQQQL